MDITIGGAPRPDDLGVQSAGTDVPVGTDAEQEELTYGPIGDLQVKQALADLQDYKEAKANLEQQIIDNERWYQLRHWEVIRSKDNAQEPEPTSAWLFDMISNKHADAMDYYPSSNILPRAPDDVDTAKTLSDILPVILQRARFERTYRLNWWDKLKHGCAVYMPHYVQTLCNGLGDIAIDRIDLLNIFWQPGIEDIQDSRNVFVVTLEDNDLLEERWPELKGNLAGSTGGIDLSQYVFQDNIKTDNKSAVVDWYYKIMVDGREILHYAKICNGKLLFSSQNQPEEYPNGWYEHGKYPFVFDTLFPIKGYPVGFGLIAVCRDPQLYYDKLSQNVMETSLINSRIRYLMSDDLDINEDDLLDVHKPLVKCAGQARMTQERLQQIKGAPLDPQILQILQSKVDEMKETTANRDFSQGGTSGGVTAASAISALQEAGSKVSRDMIFGSYDEYKEIDYQLIGLMRQFYKETRVYRITGEDGSINFTEFNGSQLDMQPNGWNSSHTEMLMRMPEFDIEIKPQRRSPFAREAENQRALEFYSAGFFDPLNATPALACLEMMDFPNIEQVRAKIAEGQTLQQQLQQRDMVIQDLAGRLGMLQTAPEEGGEAPAPAAGGLPDDMAAAQQPAAPPAGGVM